VTLYHALRLFPATGASVNAAAAAGSSDATSPKASSASEDPVVVEHYDEIVFENPTEFFYDLYLKHLPDSLQHTGTASDRFNLTTEKTELKSISAAMGKVQEQLSVYKDKARKIIQDLDEMRGDLKTTQGGTGGSKLPVRASKQQQQQQGGASTSDEDADDKSDAASRKAESVHASEADGDDRGSNEGEGDAKSENGSAEGSESEEVSPQKKKARKK